jgi:hypothetical protein
LENTLGFVYFEEHFCSLFGVFPNWQIVFLFVKLIRSISAVESDNGRKWRIKDAAMFNRLFKKTTHRKQHYILHEQLIPQPPRRGGGGPTPLSAKKRGPPTLSPKAILSKKSQKKSQNRQNLVKTHYESKTALDEGFEHLLCVF